MQQPKPEENSQSASGQKIIGIEIGGHKCVVCHISKNGLEYVQNDLSQIEILSILSFNCRHRQFADIALANIKKNYKNTILYPSLCLGLYRDSEAQYQHCTV